MRNDLAASLPQDCLNLQRHATYVPQDISGTYQWDLSKTPLCICRITLVKLYKFNALHNPGVFSLTCRLLVSYE